VGPSRRFSKGVEFAEALERAVHGRWDPEIDATEVVPAPEVPPGTFQDTIVVDLAPGETRRLRMVAGRCFGSVLSLKID